MGFFGFGKLKRHSVQHTRENSSDFDFDDGVDSSEDHYKTFSLDKFQRDLRDADEGRAKQRAIILLKALESGAAA